MIMLSMHGLSIWCLKFVLMSWRGWLVIWRKRLRQWFSCFIIPPCPYAKVANESNLVIINQFWKEFNHFQQQTGPFAKFRGRFSMPDAVNGNSFIWHQLYSLPYTKVLGFVACHNTSKQLRIVLLRGLGVMSIRSRMESGLIWVVYH